jgi:hypothetical protein
MSEGKPMVTWECDRCRKAGAVLPVGEQPKGWVGLIVTDPPRRDVHDSGPRAVLCPACVSSFLEWKSDGVVR